MASLFSKATNFLASLAHRGLDKAIESNSPEYLKQVIRNVEGAVSEAAMAVASAKGELVAARQDASDTETQIAKLNAGIDRLLGDNDPKNDHYADPLEAQLVEKEKQLAMQKEVVAAGEQTVQSVMTAWKMLQQKHSEMVTKLGSLTALDQAARAKKAGAQAVKAATDVMGGIDGQSVDNLERKIRKDNAVADELLRQSTGAMEDDPMKAVRDSEVADRIAARRARLAAQSGASAAAPADSTKTGGAPVSAAPGPTTAT